MKIAVFSDVQGNLPALETVMEDILIWDPELVILNGDLVNRGPLSLDCLLRFEEMRQARGWVALKGNHEDYVLHCRWPAENALEAELRRFADWTCHQLGQHGALIANWADHLTLAAEGSNQWIHVTHGTLGGNRRGISQSVTDEQLADQLPEDIELFVTAHTHKVHQRIYGTTRILNIGSVGSPFDGDPRASYGRLTFRANRWHSEIIRLAYDRARCERDFHQSGFLVEGGPLARVIFQEWKRAELLMPRWKQGYLDAVTGGTISLERSIQAFLDGL